MQIAVVLALLSGCFFASLATERRSSQSTEPISVAYCDLLRDPGSYDQKLIRVRAIYSSHFEMSSLRNANCTRDFLWTWVDFNYAKESCTRPDVLKTFEAAVASRSPETTEADMDKAEVVFVGRFEVARNLEIKNTIPENGFGHMGMYRFRLTVSCIEAVKPLSAK